MNSNDVITADGQLWGARFRSPTNSALKDLSRSPARYFALLPYDIAGSRAHATELHRASILDADELSLILQELNSIEADFQSGEVHQTDADEDVHGFIERLLVERLGKLGGKLRAGRSRNDQTANDLRLYLRDNARALAESICELQDALLEQSERHTNSIAPGFTHLQPAQPIVFAHQLMAHAQSFARDIDRLQDWDRRSALSPLGAAALSGSAIAVSPELSATEMGYSAPCENSIDAVASRDHVAEFLFIASMFTVNLSRLSEEFCLWVSNQFQWVELDDAFATGSSIMPQKKNPDVAELTRGKAGRILGNLTGLLATLKSLPLSYNRDLSEDKAAVLDTVEALSLIIPATSGMVRTMTVNVHTLAEQATHGFTLATEVADWLSRRGVPFREAHEISGELVRYCEENSLQLHEASDEELARVDARLIPEVRDHLTVDAAFAARSGYGSTSPKRVEEQIARLRQRTSAQNAWAVSYTGPRA